MSEQESKAQQAGETALLAVYEDGDAGGCSCQTCVVREVLEAAWPHLRALALEEASHELMGVSLGSKDPTELIHELARLIDEWRSA